MTPPFAGSLSDLRDKALANLIPRIDGLCEADSLSSWEPTSDSEMGDSGTWQIHFQRKVAGISVEGDYLEMIYGPDPAWPGTGRAWSIEMRCQPAFSTLVDVSPDVGADEARAVVGAQANDDARLLFVKMTGTWHLAWKVQMADDGHAVDHLVSAHTGEVIGQRAAGGSAGSHDGTLRLEVRRPHGAGLVQGGLTHADIWKDDVETTWLGTASQTGSYSVSHGDADHTWETYFSGPYVRDFNVTNIPGFAATGGRTYTAAGDFGGTNTNTQRRAEAYYGLNYVRSIAKAAWSATPEYSSGPLQFDVPTGGAGSCDGRCCNGANRLLELFGWCNGVTRGEAKFRFFQYHEWGHSPRSAYADNNGVAYNPSCTLCVPWLEGMADAVATMTNRVEQLREFGAQGCGTNNSCSDGGTNTSDFLPDDVYPTSACPAPPTCPLGDYDTANIFNGVSMELYLQLGWRDALSRVLESVDGEVNGSTAWTGSNSFYEHMLASDLDFWDIGAWQLTISQAWKKHDATTTNANWNWTDQWPGAATPSFMLRPTNPFGAWQTFTGGPDSFLPRNAIDFNKDRDYTWYYTYEGETYRFRTWNLCQNLDPMMEWIRFVSGAESVGITSYDCADPGYGNNPCISFEAGSNGWGAVRIRQEVAGSATGCYDLQVQVMDDIGDTPQASRAAANSGAWYDARWEESGDVDYFRVYVADSGAGIALDVETCEQTAGSNPDTVISLYHQGDLTTAVATDDDGGTCGTGNPLRSSKISYQVPAGKTGFYYVKVVPYNSSSTGSWKLKATQTGGSRDVGGSSRATAFVVSTDELTGRYVAGDFSSGNDEDWFRVTLGEQERVTFHTADGTADPVLWLFDNDNTGYQYISIDPTKTWLRMDDDGGYETNHSQLHFVAPRAGDYFIRARPYSAAKTGTYTVFVQQMGSSATAYPAYP
ncbi:MAG: hypothetical protein AMXMBFR64_62760 [Myxococcales bacterium]